MGTADGKKPGRNSGKSYSGKLRVPLDFDEALKAATEAKPPEKPPRKPRRKKKANR